MIGLYDKIKNKTLIECIEEDPVSVKKSIEQGEYSIDERSNIFLNKKYYNIVNLDYNIRYNLNTKSYTIESPVSIINGFIDVYDQSNNIYELKVINSILNVIRTKFKNYDVNSITINVYNKRVYEILNKKQRYFDVYSLEFKLWYKIAKFTKNIKLNVNYGSMG